MALWLTCERNNTFNRDNTCATHGKGWKSLPNFAKSKSVHAALKCAIRQLRVHFIIFLFAFLVYALPRRHSSCFFVRSWFSFSLFIFGRYVAHRNTRLKRGEVAVWCLNTFKRCECENLRRLIVETFSRTPSPVFWLDSIQNILLYGFQCEPGVNFWLYEPN